MPSMMSGRLQFSILLALIFSFAPSAIAQYPSVPLVITNGATVVLENYATLPISARGGNINNFGPGTNYADQLARPNFLVSEPANAPLSSSRFFVPDLNRSLFILDKNTKAFTSYLNFQSIFPRFYNAGGFAGGLITVVFDPDYETNGLFYTVHVETPPGMGQNANPTAANTPGLNLTGYTITSAINAPAGNINYINVLVEWKDTNVSNVTFEGTAREIMRTGQGDRIHPMGDLLFNPLAQPGDSDYRNLYISIGDGRAGELGGVQRTIPQRLDAIQGKVLRITPDINLRPADELSANGRYRIPTTGSDPNPFVSVSLANLKKEIYAYGFRNPHRISWDPVSNLILLNDIGLHSYEEVNIVHKGGNYGYSEREGTQQLFVPPGYTGDWSNISFTVSDSLTVTGIVGSVTPLYPVAAYSHNDGDAVSSGDVYRGTLMPQLYGKYVFGDITTGRIFYCDLEDLVAADDGVRTTVATIHEIQLQFDSPYDNPNTGVTNRRMFDIVAEQYAARGGKATNTFGVVTGVLPGSADVTTGNDPYGVFYGRGRADLRLALGGDGEMYIISKSDGTIRKMVAASVPGDENAPPSLDPIPNQEIPEGSTLSITNAATDDGVFTFSLDAGAPNGADIDSDTGVFTWTPTEEQGPSTNSISVIVTDDGTPSLTATQTFVVVVTEVNEAPQLTALPDQFVVEGDRLSVTNIATDEDLPVNLLTFSLGDGAPEGAQIDTATGIIDWSTTEADGPSTNTFNVIVTDNGQPGLSATQSLTIIIIEQNIAPQLDPVADWMVHEGETVMFAATATDPDLPANTLTYSLDAGSPASAQIGPVTGEFTWTTQSGDGGSTNSITIRVTDDGETPLDDARVFTVVVAGPPTIESITVTNELAFIAWQSLSNRTYRLQHKSEFANEWENIPGDVTAEGELSSKMDAATNSATYYRLQVLPLP
ncbi:MAG TPA: PQQ-dependent sugar dehydrogenase [Verrucomicrobiota bacterium]|nr:PQQ-dependent sugar dehydrogenase [Verrucomicrobiota bacterium]